MTPETPSDSERNPHELPHVPVLSKEVIEYLSPKKDHLYVDGTFGAGGYSRGILERKAYVYGIDRDPHARKAAEALGVDYPKHFTFLSGCFGDMASLLSEEGVKQVAGIALDLGVSSPQIDTPERGFSFRFEGPLDMRMGETGVSAADVVNSFEESELADIIYHYGEERHARKVAKKIVEARKEAPIETTTALADLVRSVVRKSKDGIDPATRTFQGLRIYVNNELGELERALETSKTLLSPGGRLVVVSFHSLEDRMVKRFMKSHSDRGSGTSRHLPQGPLTTTLPLFEMLHKGAIKPSVAECKANPRARSARLRACEKTKEKV